MRLQELAEFLDLIRLNPSTETNCRGDACDISQGHASDLLSDILAHAPAQGILVTTETQPDIVSAASMARLSAVIFSCNRAPDEDVAARAAEEGLSLYVTPARTFDVVGRLYALGIRGFAPPGCQRRGLPEKEPEGRGVTRPGSLEVCPERSP